MTTRRQPNQADLLTLAKVLAAYNVEYVVIGGAAMALHGFPRMTKDIDLLLPVDPANNDRLLQALESIPGNEEFLSTLRQEWMDQGFSTALEGVIDIDLLYVAASKSFEELRHHIQIVSFNDIPVVTLDVDGMLLTKQTTRESDIPDRLKLERLKTAKQALTLQSARIKAIPALKDSSGVIHTFWRVATEAIEACGGDVRLVDWRTAEQVTIRQSIGKASASMVSQQKVSATFFANTARAQFSPQDKPFFELTSSVLFPCSHLNWSVNRPKIAV